MTENFGSAILLAVGSLVVFARKWGMLRRNWHRLWWTPSFPIGCIWLAYEVYRMQDKMPQSGGLLMLATGMIAAVLWSYEDDDSA